MDIYGYGALMLGAARQIPHDRKMTGRTELMMSLLRDGDVVVFESDREATRVKRDLLSRRNIIIETLVDSTFHLRRLSERCRKADGRVFFDHQWLEAFWQTHTQYISQDLKRFCDARDGTQRRSEKHDDIVPFKGGQF